MRIILIKAGQESRPGVSLLGRKIFWAAGRRPGAAAAAWAGVSRRLDRKVASGDGGAGGQGA